MAMTEALSRPRVRWRNELRELKHARPHQEATDKPPVSVFKPPHLLPPRQRRVAGRALGLCNPGVLGCQDGGGWGEPLGTYGQSPDTPTHALQFNNLGQRALPISVVFWVPIQLNQVAVWDDPQVTFSQVSPTGPEEWAQLLPPEPWSFLKSQISLLDSGAFVTLVWT